MRRRNTRSTSGVLVAAMLLDACATARPVVRAEEAPGASAAASVASSSNGTSGRDGERLRMLFYVLLVGGLLAGIAVTGVTVYTNRAPTRY